MEYVLNSQMAKEIDRFTIDDIGVPSVILMERAALSVAEKTAETALDYGKNVRICAVCGCGNNGADGIAAARILTWRGIKTDIIIAGDETKATPEFFIQKKIAENSHMNFYDVSKISSYNIIIDAIFGTGLSRRITGNYSDIIRCVNDSEAVVISVDIPSGIDSTTGAVLGVAVRADRTVTFGFRKQGHMLYPGRGYCGAVTVADIGFFPDIVKKLEPAVYYTREDIRRIPERKQYSNKGTYGRTLVIAGSPGMSGAAYLAAAAAYRSGAGLVEVLTDEDNCHVIRTLLPEAIVTGYTCENASDMLESALSRAGCIIIGPGLSKSITAQMLVRNLMKEAKMPVVADADALNIIADDISILAEHGSDVVITPHVGEMCRLSGLDKNEVTGDLIKTASDMAEKYNVICVLKDAATVVAGADHRRYINSSGCGAMSKGGMGDVLSGVIAGLLSVGMDMFEAAAMAVYVHGLAGEAAAIGKSSHSVTAGDVLEKLSEIY